MDSNLKFAAFIPSISFLLILIVFIIDNFTQKSRKITFNLSLLLYLLWSIALGSRYVFDGDPGIYYAQITNFSVRGIWNHNFPKIDVLLMLIMKLFSFASRDYQFVMTMTESTLMILLFQGVSKFSKKNVNSLLIVLSYLIFTNGGILLFGNFLRQGLAASCLINSVLAIGFVFSKSSLKDKLINYKKLLIAAGLQIFSHISSLFVLIIFYVCYRFKPSLNPRITSYSLSLIVVELSIILTSLGSSVILKDIYGSYDYESEETSEKLAIKLLINAVMICFLYTLELFRRQKRFLSLREVTSNEYLVDNFKFLLKVCFFLIIFCMFSSMQGATLALRTEYYLNLLVILCLAQFVANISLKKNVRLILTSMAIVIMYMYSFYVYSNEAIIRVMNYDSPQPVKYQGF